MITILKYQFELLKIKHNDSLTKELMIQYLKDSRCFYDYEGLPDDIDQDAFL